MRLNAKLGLPEIKYGMGGAGGSTQLWRHLPIPIAMSMLLTGESMSAEDALKFHLINEIVEPEHLMERALEIAGKIAAMPPLAVSVEMEAFYRSMDLSRQESRSADMHEEALEADSENRATCIDCHKGIAHRVPEGFEPEGNTPGGFTGE